MRELQAQVRTPPDSGDGHYHGSRHAHREPDGPSSRGGVARDSLLSPLDVATQQSKLDGASPHGPGRRRPVEGSRGEGRYHAGHQGGGPDAAFSGRTPGQEYSKDEAIGRQIADASAAARLELGLP